MSFLLGVIKENNDKPGLYQFSFYIKFQYFENCSEIMSASWNPLVPGRACMH